MTKIVNWIEKIEKIDPGFFTEMRNSSHAYSDEKQNPYHLEHNGNIYGHVLEVYTQAQERYPEDEILHLAALLHDIAKPMCRDIIEEKQRVSFYNHESMGVFLAVDILGELKLNSADKVRVLEIIQRHADSYKLSKRNLGKLYNNELFVDALKIRACDMYGRIALEGNSKDAAELAEAIDYKFEEFPSLKEYKNTCTLMVGPPGSGKSTALKGVKDVLSRDDCLMELATTSDYGKAWNEVDPTDVDKLFEFKLRSYLGRSADFYIDMTNMNVKSRRKFTERFKNVFNLDCIVFLTPYKELLKRNAGREGKVLKEYIIENMCKRFQMPYEGEGFRNIEYVF